MEEPKFSKATEVVAHISTESDYVELIPVQDEDPIEVVATKVVIDSISTESDKIGE